MNFNDRGEERFGQCKEILDDQYKLFFTIGDGQFAK